MRVLNTNSLDGLRAIAVLHIVLSHHSAYTGYIERNAPSAAPEADADEADAFGCSPKWCTSPDGAGSTDCWAGSGSEGCTCALGEARMTGQVYNGTMVYRGQVYDGAFYEYECCLPPTNYTDLMGIVRTAGTNYTDLVGVACGSFIPPVAALAGRPDAPHHVGPRPRRRRVDGAVLHHQRLRVDARIRQCADPPAARPPPRPAVTPTPPSPCPHPQPPPPQVPDARCREAPNARTAAATAPRPTRAAASRASARRAR